MNIQQFQYILAAADSKNFEEAAEKCFVTQSTLSTMINKYEKEIGIKIFNRKTKPVTITQEGSLILNRLRVINNEIDVLDNVIQEIKGEMVGDLKIGVIPTIAPHLLPLFINEFALKFPKVNIQVRELTTDQIQENLLLRNLDIGILALPISHKDLIEYPIYNEPFLIYDCTGEALKDKISPEDLNFSKICLLEDGHCLRTQVYDICKLSEKYTKNTANLKFESGSMESLLRITETSKGVTILPYLAYKNLPTTSQKNIIQFKNPIPVRSIGLITHRFFVKKALRDALFTIIQKSVAPLINESKPTKIINPL